MMVMDLLKDEVGELTLQEFAGDHYEIGLHQGRKFKHLIARVTSVDFLTGLEAFQLVKPKLIPARLFLWLGKRRATSLLKDDLFKYYPQQARRLEGMAKGSLQDLGALFSALQGELLMSQIDYRLGACTAFGLRPKRTTFKEPVVVKNLDTLTNFAPFSIVRRCRPKEGYETLETAFAHLPCGSDSMNEHGLTVCYNYGFGTDKPRYMVPISVVCQEMLEQCRTTEEAVTFLKDSKRAGGALLLVGDPTGDIRAVELSPNYIGVRKPEGGYVAITNHYLTEEMKPHDIPHNAYYADKNPKALRGKRVHESSECRYDRAVELIGGEKRLDEQELGVIISDHGKDGKGSDVTICNHGEYWTTIRSIMFFPERRMMRVLYGHPCRGQYSEFIL